MPMPTPDFEWIFTEGRTFTFPEDDQAGVIGLMSGGELALPTGRVAACDPLVTLGEELEGFTATVPPGRYPVSVAVVTIGDPAAAEPHQRVAAARLVIKDVPPVSWDMALQPEQELTDLTDDEFYGYGVDAGTGCFADASVDSRFAGGQGAEDSQLFDAINAAGWTARPINHTDPATGQQVVVFFSGWGDGAYPTWVGRDASGEVCCFVTDFFVVPPEAIPGAVGGGA
ncbi:DUF4241 domain-containing protein [Streptomyces sp. SL13]|jgi:hypothetical protein|uniref:DUF4241 domain-containing protein n=1 Tax=Streptantibioticus silvisoli TaxID=2705255 RepID=A0AA90H7N8_9ACTN|nr:DUF4241 domain-containing protein [Streptantibioticus silvisoli]MDI5963162.1 DUF4241 domain-containing protein [Streptantibioticus silvisoli]MDI5970325.1 DUF4241 domain-containing protein [Streptantibioticus silvisoli]